MQKTSKTKIEIDFKALKAPSKCFLDDRAVLDCLDSLQPAERMQRELGSSLADAKWSAAAAKLASQCRSPASRSFAGGTVRMLGAKHECKYPLCDAGF